MSNWAGKHVAVVGLGISNMPLIDYLVKQGASISVRDRKSEVELGDRAKLLHGLGVDCRMGPDYLSGLEQYDAVFLTPGIPKHLPEIQALVGQVPVLSEIALVFALAKAPIYGITGSSGKTTVTTLVGEMLKASGVKCHVGGNIGVPLIGEIEQIPEDEPIVLELSSFQLELLNQSPHGALVTNISENHLDVHLSMESYIQAKKQIYLHQTPEDVALFNYDDPVTRCMAQEAKGQVFFFSRKARVNPGIFLDGQRLVFQDRAGIVPLIAKQDIGLIGEHNMENVMAAALLAYCAGGSWQGICQAASGFKGVAHRLEHIAAVNQVDYYNDSIATSPARAVAGINSFGGRPLILIAGGYDKKLGFAEFAKVVSQKVKALILLGQTAGQIEAAVREASPHYHHIYRAGDLEQAVAVAAQMAVAGDVVLLSPACASFDMYPGFEARGEHFRRLVQGLASSVNSSNQINGGMISGKD
ncbi:MAG: UDP-N-acetylmuramoyl-L-alanine--D-glutamate ligase [Firmicutes bacterium]|jgi:UDP-N-acetylmuramoylalanine--D-glutamate ligase|nr:UDP-N-acetylmuramoyl-L-alanine--D-glutamate ligase [Bacillota bacterium]NLL89050.1 UDP-N-acetylmuramoyl-L-alanine--D-glutamate ligase [Bacillota bacterium]HKM17007.1 UDP-N-acetylmuramoyl-L-alanine--D-glutamate ligase [Limnochordia bacterium]